MIIKTNSIKRTGMSNLVAIPKNNGEGGKRK